VLINNLVEFSEKPPKIKILPLPMLRQAASILGYCKLAKSELNPEMVFCVKTEYATPLIMPPTRTTAFWL
jgi:hypothetical protein